MALHFVTRNLQKFDVDGAIWAVDLFKIYEILPEELKACLKGPKVFTVDELYKKIKKFEDFKKFSSEDYMILFEPPSLDERIVNQYALFSVMSRSDTIPEDWLKKRANLCKKFIIPKELKSKIRDRLDMANLTERVFFPGLDGLSQWLKRHYGPPYS